MTAMRTKLLQTTTQTLADVRQVRVVCSTDSIDRMGDVIEQAGIDLTAYRTNPVVLWSHDPEVPVATALDIGVVNGKLQATVQFPPEGQDADADRVYGKIKAGIVNATSVGFRPLSYEPIDAKQPWDGFRFLKSELLEFSFVSIPANKDCLVVGRSIFTEDKPEPPRKSIFVIETEKALSADMVRRLQEATRRWLKAGTDRTPLVLTDGMKMREFQEPAAADIEIKAAADWKVGAARDLPIDDKTSWDGPAAETRMFDACGMDGDSPDTAKCRRGFLIYDAANPALKGSYKEPFADIVGGELKAVAGGIRAAASRLPATDAPQDVKDEARKVLDAYEAKMGAGKAFFTPNEARAREGLPAVRRFTANEIAATFRMGADEITTAGRKGLFEVGQLADLLGQLAWIEDWVEFEESLEQDGSDIAARLTEALQMLGQILVDMTVEEVGELLSDESGDDTGAIDMPMLMSTGTPAQKALLKLTRIAKAGRVLSAKNESDLKQAHGLIAGVLDQVAPTEEPPAVADDHVVNMSADMARARAKAMLEVDLINAA